MTGLRFELPPALRKQPETLKDRILWFIGLWVAGSLTLVMFSYLFRLLFKAVTG